VARVRGVERIDNGLFRTPQGRGQRAAGLIGEATLKNFLNDPRVQWLAYDKARQAGNAAGVVRGAWHGAKGTAEGAYFLARLVNPMDLLRGPERSAQAQLVKAERAAADYIRRGVRDPKIFERDARSAIHKADVDLNPGASPKAKTFAGEVRRNFNIGQNQGELAFNVASTVRGGPIVDSLAGLARVEKGVTAAKLVAAGYDPRLEAHFAKPYKGMGHHFWPRRLKLWKWLRDSPLAVYKPRGLTLGQFLERHYNIDPKYSGGPIPLKLGGGGWSGEKLGWEKYNLPGRLLYGSPPALKSAVLGGVVGAGLVDQRSSSEEPW
jgi:hypothetical protein